MDLIEAEDPIVRKLSLYILAHRNYLWSLPYTIMRNHKINWGLKKVLKIDEFEESYRE